jgi:plastocyanin
MKALLALAFVGPLLAVACNNGSSAANQSTSAAASPNVAAVTHTIVIRQMEFSPATLTVHPGDSIEWKNDDVVAHTATASTFDSGSIAPGQRWRHTFTQSSSNAFHCIFHPHMKGTIIIQ